MAGPKFGIEAGSVMIISRALYGLKSSGGALRSMGYKATESDPDVWMKKDYKESGSLTISISWSMLTMSYTSMQRVNQIWIRLD